MLNLLFHILILIIVVGAILYIVNLLPLDITIKKIGQAVVLVIAAIYAISLILPMAQAQPTVPDILGRILQRTDNSNLNCSVFRTLDRNGDIRYLRLECRAYGSGRR